MNLILWIKFNIFYSINLFNGYLRHFIYALCIVHFIVKANIYTLSYAGVGDGNGLLRLCALT